MVAWRRAMGWVICLVFVSGLSMAQVTTGMILGTVSDSTGAVIPSAEVKVTNTDTGIARTVTSNPEGRYTAPQLIPGNYEVTVSASGFQTVTRRGLSIAVGQSAVLDFRLQLGAVTEEVNVTSDAPLIETTSSAVSGLVSQTQMRELPLNARSYEQLALLQPNVYYQRNAFSTTNTGYAPKLSAAGMRSEFNAYVVDGTDVMDTNGQTPGSVAGQLLGVETLREFRVLTNNYPAQYGRGLGAVIDVVSRSGSNDIHGSAFEFLRNDKLDARNFFDPAKPPFRRNQFGAVVGGPIVRDRAFFFASYEAMRERLTSTNLVFVPDDQAKLGILPDPSNPGGTISIPVNPAIRPLLALYPSPQAVLGSGIGTYRFPFTGSVREDFIAGRIDYQHSSSTSYFGRYSIDDTDKVQQRGPNVLPPWAEGLASKDQTVTLAETRLLSSQLVNEFRAGFVRYTPRSQNVLTGADPKLQFPGTIGQGIISLGFGFSASAQVLANLGSPGRAFENFTGNTFQFSDTLSYSLGSHFLKAGVNFERFQDNVGNLTETGLYAFQSTYTFQSMPDLLTGTARTFTGTGSPSAVGISGRQSLLGLFVQDDYRLRPNVILNLGLRYESPSNYSNVNKRFIILNSLFGTPQPGREKAWGGRTCGGCFEPRFGLAWDVFSDGKTALKAGFGVFHGQLVRFQAFNPLPTGTVGGTNIVVDNPAFPNPTVTAPGAVVRVIPTGTVADTNRIIPLTPKTPTALHWNVTIDQQLTQNFTARIAYEGSRGYHLEGSIESNSRPWVIRPDGIKFFPPGPGRFRPEFGRLDLFAYDYNSNYHSLILTLGKRLSHGLHFEGSYAFSKNTDDTSIGGVKPANVTNETWLLDERRNKNHGLSGLDMRQRVILNGSYVLPSLSRKSVANKLFSGWQLNSIVTLQAGVPLTPFIGFDWANSFGTRPNAAQRPSFNPSLKPSIRYCPCDLPASLGGSRQEAPQRYFDPTVFVLPEQFTYGGNAGRNIIIGPGLVNFDFALAKNIPVTEKLELQFRAEGFNTFNNVNWGLPQTIAFQTNGAFSASGGRITSTSTTGRQLQFALKLVF